LAFINNILINDVDTVDESIGFNLPFTLETQNLSTTTLQSTKTNLTSLLTTQRGERVFQPGLGIDIRGNLFEPIVEESFISLEEDILAQIAIWLPFLQVDTINIQPEPDANKVTVNINYSFKSTPELNDSVQVNLNTGASY
tara:strand:- start:1077 stop:1499 length:423 start_codon:yes stop_codon:yes gene_type:complete